MQTKTLCEVCRKNTKGTGSVFYDRETFLCKSYYTNFLKNKIFTDTSKKFRTAKPCTKQWVKKCEAEGSAYNKWLKEVK